MDNSILTCKYVNKILENDENLMSKISINKFNALYFDPNTVTFPFVHYARTSLIPTYSKDLGLYFSTVQITYNVVSDKYLESIEIANALRNALEQKGYRDDDIFIDRIELLSVSESTQNDAFVQTLIFETTVS